MKAYLAYIRNASKRHIFLDAPTAACGKYYLTDIDDGEFIRELTWKMREGTCKKCLEKAKRGVPFAQVTAQARVTSSGKVGLKEGPNEYFE
jgi:hypothetical protein